MTFAKNGIEPKFGRTATKVVAGYDMPNDFKLQADSVCDGVADNVDIQSVIGTGNCRVILAGTFNLSAAIDIGFNKLNISGLGRGLTTIKPAGGIHAFANTTTGVTELSIENLTIDGQNQTGVNNDGIHLNRVKAMCRNVRLYRISGNGIYFDAAGSSAYLLDMETIFIDNLAGNNGINLTNVGFATMKNIFASNHSAGNGVIRIVGGSSQYPSPGNVLIDGVSAYNISGVNAGIFIQNMRENRLSISNVDVYLATSMGVQVIGGTTRANAQWSDISIENFSGRYIREAGISLDYVRGVRVIDGSCIGQNGTSSEGEYEGEGLDIVNCSDITVIGGNYSHNDGAGITVWNSDNVLIDGAMAYNNGAYRGGDPSESGIRIRYWDDTTDRVRVTNCMVVDNQATAVNALTGNANAGQKAVPVTDGTLFFRYQKVQLAEGATNEYNEVDYVYGNTVYLRYSLTNSYTLAGGATLQGIATQRTGIIELSHGAGSITNDIIEGNVVKGNYLSQITTISTDTVVKDNEGFKTKNTGQDTITAGNGTVIVNHGLAVTPDTVLVSPRSDPGVGLIWWVDTITATQFTINVSPNTVNDLVFDWQVYKDGA